MHVPRLTLRKLMIAIAIIATVVLTPLAWLSATLRDFNASFQGAYGKDGLFDLERQIATELKRGDNALRQRDFAGAEARYRAVLTLHDRLRAVMAKLGVNARFDPTGDAEMGIADALAGQGRNAEAEPNYTRSLAAMENRFGRDHFAMADVLQRYARFLRATGRVSEAEKLENRATRIRDDHVRRSSTGPDHKPPLVGLPRPDQAPSRKVRSATSRAVGARSGGNSATSSRQSTPGRGTAVPPP
jgi:tetratricopeptide (TPR) repeat protein